MSEADKQKAAQNLAKAKADANDDAMRTPEEFDARSQRNAQSNIGKAVPGIRFGRHTMVSTRLTHVENRLLTKQEVKALAS